MKKNLLIRTAALTLGAMSTISPLAAQQTANDPIKILTNSRFVSEKPPTEALNAVNASVTLADAYPDFMGYDIIFWDFGSDDNQALLSMAEYLLKSTNKTIIITGNKFSPKGNKTSAELANELARKYGIEILNDNPSSIKAISSYSSPVMTNVDEFIIFGTPLRVAGNNAITIAAAASNNSPMMAIYTDPNSKGQLIVRGNAAELFSTTGSKAGSAKSKPANSVVNLTIDRVNSEIVVSITLLDDWVNDCIVQNGGRECVVETELWYRELKNNNLLRLVTPTYYVKGASYQMDISKLKNGEYTLVMRNQIYGIQIHKRFSIQDGDKSLRINMSGQNDAASTNGEQEAAAAKVGTSIDILKNIIQLQRIKNGKDFVSSNAAENARVADIKGYEGKMKEEQSLYEACTASNNYTDYLTRYPKGKYVAAIKAKQKEAEAGKRLAALPAIFDEIIKENPYKIDFYSYIRNMDYKGAIAKRNDECRNWCRQNYFGANLELCYKESCSTGCGRSEKAMLELVIRKDTAAAIYLLKNCKSDTWGRDARILGDIYLAQGKINAAIEQYRYRLEHDGNREYGEGLKEIAWLVGKDAFDKGNYGDAYKFLIRAYMYYTTAEQFHTLAYSAYRVNKFEDADTYYTKALQLAPTLQVDANARATSQRIAADLREEKRIAEAQRQEAERKAAAQRAEAERRAAEQARVANERRLTAIRNAGRGEKLIYNISETWEGGIWIFHNSVTTSSVVTCFIESKEGDRYHVRVGDVQTRKRNNTWGASERDYVEIYINGVRVNKGDVIWVKPLEGSRWIYGE
jgi:tetratricopeptide (TPR) repeat protein